MLLANMCLLPKPHKDHTSPQNHRLISVINNDLKVFVCLLVDRVAAVITSLIHPDQTGFIPVRQITDNLRLVTNIIQDVNLDANPVVILSLDIHKAFDRVSWSYLELLLPKYSLCNEFMHGFRALYQNLQTRIKLPGENTEFFALDKGTRQGCPLSPLLFILTIEPLACAIRENVNIKGYSKGLKDFKLSLYADDVLLFLLDPLISLPNLIKVLEAFQDLTGLGVNLVKCTAMPINIPPLLAASLRERFSFTWTSHSFKYLGILLTPSYKTLFQTNYPPNYGLIITSPFWEE